MSFPTMILLLFQLCVGRFTFIDFEYFFNFLCKISFKNCVFAILIILSRILMWMLYYTYQ